MCALTVIAQIAITLLVTRLLEESANVVYFVLRLAGTVVAVRVYSARQVPAISWCGCVLLLALPVSGMILFWLWGGTHQAKSLSLRKIPVPLERESLRIGKRRQIF